MKYQIEGAPHSKGPRGVGGEAQGARHRDNTAELHSVRRRREKESRIDWSCADAGIRGD